MPVVPRTATVAIDDLILAVSTFRLLIERPESECSPAVDRLAVRVVDRLERAIALAYE